MHEPGASAELPHAEGPEQRAAAVEANANEPAAAPGEPDLPDVYKISTNGSLWCCEILSDVAQRRQSFRSLREAEPELERIVHPYCIVVSQDCDLDQDFHARQDEGASSPLPNVLLCEASTATELKGIVPAGRDIWKRIIQNKDERYQFLQATAPEQDAANEGLPELGIDFRRHFSVPTDELYEQFGLGARRRCRLVSPYKEHFMNRFANFMARVGLPSDHFSE